MRPIDADALKVDWYDDYETEDGDEYSYTYVSTYQIDHAPTIDAVPQWIPCEERLPEDGEYVLAWAKGSVDVVKFEMGISQETREKMKNGEILDPIHTTWCLSDGYTESKRSDLYDRSDEAWNNKKPYCWVHGFMEYFGQDVKAWMPLPEPYEGKRKDDEID